MKLFLNTPSTKVLAAMIITVLIALAAGAHVNVLALFTRITTALAMSGAH